MEPIITLDPVPEDEEMEASETRVDDYFIQYDLDQILLSKIDDPDFEAIYKVFDIKNKPFQVQVEFYSRMLKKIEEEFNLKFEENIFNFNDLNHLKDIREFIEFITFDNKVFMGNVLEYLTVGSTPINIMEIDMEKYLKEKKGLLDKVLIALSKEYNNQIIKNFILTCNMVDFIKWFVKNFNRSKAEVLIQMELRKIMEEELQNKNR